MYRLHKAEEILPDLALVSNVDNAKNQLSPRFFDFWLMGGASILVWVAVTIGQFFRNDHSFVEQRFQQVAGAFALLSLVCNHPHFMASYGLAYGRGRRFCLQHWFCLLAVPLGLIALYAFSFYYFESPAEGKWITDANAIFHTLGMGYRLGESSNLGIDLLGITVWIMYLTVGWHYAKQSFGCMMSYAHYDAYPLTGVQRNLIKLGLFSIAFYSFCRLSFHWRELNNSAGFFSFLMMPVTELGLPTILDRLSSLIVGVGALAFISVLAQVYWRKKRLPSLNFLVPYVSLFVWWGPLLKQKEFTMMMVPFFHSLQYLPFAYRMELAHLHKGRKLEKNFALRLIFLLICGFLAFEAVPGVLDSLFSQSIGQFAMFFTIAFAVFINVHHFFLDSVLWKFQDPKVKFALFSAAEGRRR